MEKNFLRGKFPCEVSSIADLNLSHRVNPKPFSGKLKMMPKQNQEKKLKFLKSMVVSYPSSFKKNKTKGFFKC